VASAGNTPAPPCWSRTALPSPLGSRWQWDVTRPDQLALVRREIRRRLDRSPGLPDADSEAGERLLLAVEELTSNGLRHGRLPVRAVITVAAGEWLLDVSDHAPAAPPTAVVDRDPALGGMGLQLTASLATAHGWITVGDRKHVWACVPFSPLHAA